MNETNLKLELLDRYNKIMEDYPEGINDFITMMQFIGRIQDFLFSIYSQGVRDGKKQSLKDDNAKLN